MPLTREDPRPDPLRRSSAKHSTPSLPPHDTTYHDPCSTSGQPSPTPVTATQSLNGDDNDNEETGRPTPFLEQPVPRRAPDDPLNPHGLD